MKEKDYYSLLGEEISSLRSSRNVNQDDLATFLNISRPSIGNIEKGRQKPSMYLMQQIADYFGVDLNSLLPEIPKQMERMRIVGADEDLLKNECVIELFELVISKK